MAKGNLYVKVTAGRRGASKKKFQDCPYCGAPAKQDGIAGPVNCSNPSCEIYNWNIGPRLWNDIHPVPTGELKSAYEQFRSSLEAEKEKIAEIVRKFAQYRDDLLLKNNTTDWRGHKTDAHRMPTWVALMDEIEKYMDGEQ